jgi:hypothetical protein
MHPPPSAEVYRTPWSLYWAEEDGLLCSVTENGASLDKDAYVHIFETVRRFSRGRKVCWLADVSHAGAVDREAREYAAAESPKLIHALALITGSTFSKLLAELFMLVQKPPYTIRLFNNEAAAREWIRGFLASRPDLS